MKNFNTFLIDYIETKLNTVFETVNYFVHKKTYDPSSFKLPAGYVLVKVIKKSHGPFARFIGIFKNDKKEQFLIKILRRKYLNGSAKAFLADAVVNKTISSLFKTSKNDVDNYISLLQTKDYLILIRRYITGKDVSKSSKPVILTAYEHSTLYLKKAWDASRSELNNLISTEYPIWQTAIFPLLLIKCLIREPLKATRYLQLSYYYYLTFSFDDIFRPQYELAHRDLTPENIIKNNSDYQIIDYENSVISQEYTDLSLFLLYYYKYLDVQTILRYIKSYLPTRSSKRIFIHLSIYNLIHFLSYEEKSFPYYKDGLNCISTLTDVIIPTVNNPHESLAEKVYYNALSICSYLFTTNNSSSKDVILCYHDISENNWRFSTSVNEFYKQLIALKASHDIVPMPEMLQKTNMNKPRAVITFDDGYESIYTHAFPIMNKLNLTATVFILGTPTNRNLNTLDNNFPMMSHKQILNLISHGWNIGYHTATHPKLSSLDSAILTHEIIDTKKMLEKKLSVPISYFAYPMGIYTQKILNVIKQGKYSHAFTINAGASTNNTNLLINRIPIEGKIDLNQFKSLINPIGLLFSEIFMFLLRTKQSSIDSFSRRQA